MLLVSLAGSSPGTVWPWLQHEMVSIKTCALSCRARARLRLLSLPQVPSALLTFSWDAAVLEDIKAAGAEPESILKPELLSAIEKLS